MNMLAPLLLCAVFVAGLLVAEFRNSERGIWLTKPLASLAFVWFGLASGAMDSSYGRWILAGLLLCMLGDLLLIPQGNQRVFRAGIFAFLSGHLAYVAAFWTQPMAASGLMAGGLLAAGICGGVLVWLNRWLPAGMVWPVRVYMTVIGVMTALACGVTAAGGPWLVAAGAVAFTVSDVFVARDRFIGSDFLNRALGLPLYYAAQMMLAMTSGLIS